MRLEEISDQSLISETERLARDDRVLTVVILDHLKEIDRRRLYSAEGYGSLFEYVVDRLGYPEGQAFRRVTAMRLIAQLPEIRAKVETGALSLTSIGMAARVFRKITADDSRKREILSLLENKTTRDCEKVLSEICPEYCGDQIRVMAPDIVEFRFSAPSRVLPLVEELKGLLAHKHPRLFLGEIFEILCNIGLDTLRLPAPKGAGRRSRKEIRRRIWQRAGCACEQCGSRHALQIDHKIPRAKGGTDAEENLRLLCRACNQRAAI